MVVWTIMLLPETKGVPNDQVPLVFNDHWFWKTETRVRVGLPRLPWLLALLASPSAATQCADPPLHSQMSEVASVPNVVDKHADLDKNNANQLS